MAALLARQRRRSSRARTAAEVAAADAERDAQPGRPASRSRASNRPARCCWSTSAGAAGRSASPPPPNARGQPLLSENYYLERALGPFTEIRRGTLDDLLKRELAGVGLRRYRTRFAGGRSGRRQMDRGRRHAVALRRAAPRRARATNCCRCGCARGGRTIGGALSWEQPAKLAPFAADSPFAGLAIPPDVTVSRQVLAEPDLDLAGKTWARLADGTPLVTAEKRGQGLDRAGPHDGQCRMVEPRIVRALRRDAAAHRGDEPGRDRAGDEASAADRDASTGSAGCSARPPTARPIPAKEIATAIASPQPPAGLLRHDRCPARAQSVGRDQRNCSRSTDCRRGPSRESLRNRSRDRLPARRC